MFASKEWTIDLLKKVCPKVKEITPVYNEAYVNTDSRGIHIYRYGNVVKIQGHLFITSSIDASTAPRVSVLKNLPSPMKDYFQIICFNGNGSTTIRSTIINNELFLGYYTHSSVPSGSEIDIDLTYITKD